MAAVEFDRLGLKVMMQKKPNERCSGSGRMLVCNPGYRLRLNNFGESSCVFQLIL